ncbi:MAG: hypothetical protein IKI11_08175 [Neisseriaceae bacterium]|nr:hypothetical protein [Neisseriaceae bacterium]
MFICVQKSFRLPENHQKGVFYSISDIKQNRYLFSGSLKTDTRFLYK